MRARVLRVLGVVGVMVAVVGLAACSDDDSSDDAKDDNETTTTAASDTADESAGPATVSVAETGLGPVLVDADGKTLYLYTNDQGTTSAVPANVLAAWPPLTVESADDAVAGDGADESKLGTAEQSDGQLWVTYNGHLLYRFSGDGAAGETNGNGLGGIWYALTPAGEQVA
jgi:predicted lipoprotein with Yx(FWY)xxD motif